MSNNDQRERIRGYLATIHLEIQLEPIGLENLFLDALLGIVSELWWLIALAIGILMLYKFGTRKHPRRRKDTSFSRQAGRRVHRTTRPKSSINQAIPFKRPLGSGSRFLVGKAYVTDGDGIRIAGQEVRMVGIDAPEWDQRAKRADGRWFSHGMMVKSALIQEIGGEEVRVLIEDKDKFGRLIGTVICEGRDVGEWLVREGHAISAYDDRYKRVEREARNARRGMWSHLHNFDPRAHRHRKPKKAEDG